MERISKSAGDSVSTPASVEPTGSASCAPIAVLACTQARDWAAEMEPILIRVESLMALIEKTQDFVLNDVSAASQAVEHQDALIWALRAEVRRLSGLQETMSVVGLARSLRVAA